MQKLIKFFRKSMFVLVALLVVIPSFYRMLQPGLFSTQDFHLFRLIEFDKCIKDFQFPCRWAADAGFGYGEPLFNFYGQLPYLFGEIFHLSGLSFIGSFKLLFILSLVGSFFSMFFLAKRVWKNSFSAFISGALYVYAPYRAVDVWVRGALPEALSFVLFPLIILFLDKFLDKERRKDGIVLSLLIAALILTHNLSFILFLPILILWIIYKIYVSKKYYSIKRLFFYLLLSFLISSFYILPVLFEARYVTLETTIQGYFDFRGHFATLSQLLFSRFWGYGASLFGAEEFMSRAIGQLQWILPLLIFVLVRKKLKQNRVFFLLLLTGWFSLFMTHNQSTFIWKMIKPLSYVQFPWRFLAPALFSFSLSSGVLVNLFKKGKHSITLIVVVLAVVLNLSFFREDIWYQREDKDILQGEIWQQQISSSYKDYWSKFGILFPTEPSPLTFGEQVLVRKGSNYASYLSSAGYSKTVKFPISYFPGWKASIDGKEMATYPSGDLGLVTVDIIESGIHNVELYFSNTLVRKVGNIVSLVSLVFAVYILFGVKKNAK